MPKKITRRNHFIAQFHQRYFCFKNADGLELLWVYYKNRLDSPVAQQPIDTGIEKNLYTTTDADGKPADVVETELMTPLETRVKPIFDRWIYEKSKPEPSNIPIVSLFLSLMFARVPSQMKRIAGLKEYLMTRVLKDRAVNSETLREDWQDAKAKGYLDPEITFEQFQGVFQALGVKLDIRIRRESRLSESMSAFEMISNKMLSLKWSIGIAPDDSFFVLNDTPLNVFVPFEDGHVIFAGGFAYPQAELTFPLSPRKCLFLNQHNNPPVFKMSKLYVLEINRRACHMAARYVISPFKSNSIGKLVKEFKDAPGPIMDIEQIGEMFLQRMKSESK